LRRSHQETRRRAPRYPHTLSLRAETCCREKRLVLLRLKKRKTGFYRRRFLATITTIAKQPTRPMTASHGETTATLSTPKARPSPHRMCHHRRLSTFPRTQCALTTEPEQRARPPGQAILWNAYLGLRPHVILQRMPSPVYYRLMIRWS
jgi:hypothetical protein